MNKYDRVIQENIQPLTLYSCHLIDLSTFQPEYFLNSNIPDEIIMAILAGKQDKEQAKLLVKNILTKLHVHLERDIPELNRKIVQMEILSEIECFQEIIIEEVSTMPLILDDNKSIRFQQGLKKGLEKGLEKATKERNNAFVKYLLLNTSHSIEEIASLVNVSTEFVLKIRETIKD